MRGRRAAAVVLAVLAALAATITLTLAGCESFGEHASGERLARMKRSPEWHGDRFANPQLLILRGDDDAELRPLGMIHRMRRSQPPGQWVTLRRRALSRNAQAGSSISHSAG